MLWDRSFQFLAALATYFAPGWFEEKEELHRDDMKKRMNNEYVLFFKSWWSKIASAAGNWTYSVQRQRQRRPLTFLLYLSFFKDLQAHNKCLPTNSPVSRRRLSWWRTTAARSPRVAHSFRLPSTPPATWSANVWANRESLVDNRFFRSSLVYCTE